MEKRHFKADDFALNHPGGALGKRLLVKIERDYANHHTLCVRKNTFQRCYI